MSYDFFGNAQKLLTDLMVLFFTHTFSSVMYLDNSCKEPGFYRSARMDAPGKRERSGHPDHCACV